MKRLLLLTSVVFFTLTASAQADFKIMVFSKTVQFKHTSIPSGIRAIEKLGVENNFEVFSTKNADYFVYDTLIKYDAVLFLSTTGNVLNDEQQLAFEQYIKNGGGYAGVHAASDTEYDWPWYGELVGAFFDAHALLPTSAEVRVCDHVHPSTKDLPEVWNRTDEWYHFRTNPRGKVHVLATLNESTFNTFPATPMGFDHPIAWCQQFQGGRSWYTAMGHTDESYSDTFFLSHLLGGIQYAAGHITGDFEATDEDNYELTIIDDDVNYAIAVQALPDSRVLFLERAGNVKLYNPIDRSVKIAAVLDVNFNNEDGLLSLALDPNFQSNQWVYIFYSHTESPHNVVSRFKLNGDILDVESEERIIDIPIEREVCCHTGGDIGFDRMGNLFVATGDNTIPFQSDNYNPIDERPEREIYDAQRSAGNTRDLRGKILRIVPKSTGPGYTIPPGNLFADSTKGKLEIYAMGLRNPFKIALDPIDDYLIWGEVGPDGRTAGPRGPLGYDEFNRTNVPGNFGWPYCIADNRPYADYNFETSQIEGLFDCEMPINNSPNNTGEIILPPSKPAWIYYPYGASKEFPEFDALDLVTSEQRVAIAGDVYAYDSSNVSTTKLPPYFDKSIFLMEWSRNLIREVKLAKDGSILKINPFLTTYNWSRPIDLDIGPDGAIYIVEWGAGYDGNNPDARVIKLEYRVGNKTPIAIAESNVQNGAIPLNVSFDGSKSSDPDGDELTFDWDLDGDGVFESTGQQTSFLYESTGDFEVTLKVSDPGGLISTDKILIVAGNTAPIVNIIWPPNGGIYGQEDEILYSVEVLDEEDELVNMGVIDCEEVITLPGVGHDDHVHDGTNQYGCEGSFTTISHGSESDNVFYVFKAGYEDLGYQSASPINTTNVSILQSKIRQFQFSKTNFNASAFNFNNDNVDELEGPASDPLGGGAFVTLLKHFSVVTLDNINLKNIDYLTIRAGAAIFGDLRGAGTVEVRKDSADGELLFERYIPNGFKDGEFDYFTAPIKDPGGSSELFFVMKSDFSNQGLVLFDLNWAELYGDGVSLVNVQKDEGVWALFYDEKGNLVAKDQQPMISFDYRWGSPIEGLEKDRFKIKWKSRLLVPEDGEYQFRTDYGNGQAVLRINGREIISKKNTGQATSETQILFKDSVYVIELDYAHSNGIAKMELRWLNLNDEVEDYFHVIHQRYLNVEGVEIDTNMVTGIDQNQLTQNIMIYPNPVKESFRISSDESLSSVTSLILKDPSGKSHAVDWKLSGADILVQSIEDLSNGVYFLELLSNDKKGIKRIVKQN